MILGGHDTISNGLGVLTWEQSANPGSLFFKTLEYLDKQAFSCYGLGNNGVSKLSVSCRGSLQFQRQWNILCASSVHAPHVVTAMDALSYTFME